MIRWGKENGWLSLPADGARLWARFNNVEFTRVRQTEIEGRGTGLVASEPILHDANSAQQAPVLLRIPKDLILCRERILEHARVDQDFREVLDAIGSFGMRNLGGNTEPRGSILTFLLVQASASSPDLAHKLGVHNPFTDYVKSLPLEQLPTFWSVEELSLLRGTSLAPAIASKLKRLRREYELVCERTSGTRWYNAVHSQLQFDDWLQVDAMYRSRALDFPGIGHCMVPCLDLANHEAGEKTLAIYEVDDSTGDAILMLRTGKTVAPGEEITITYGDEKGACEMLFSYGFLESNRTTAETLFLSLDVPEHDTSRAAKLAFADCAPGFKLIDTGEGEIDWKGDFIWLLCANTEDGLRFEMAQLHDGTQEMHAFFGTNRIHDGAAGLRRCLAETGLWDVYRLRAVALLQDRIFDQLQVLYGTQDEMEGMQHGDGTSIRDPIYVQSMALRRLEFELLNGAYEDLEAQKVQLAESPVVQKYLRDQQAEES